MLPHPRPARQPGWSQEKQGCNCTQGRPGGQAGRGEQSQGILRQDRLGDLAQRQHEGPNPRIRLNLQSTGSVLSNPHGERHRPGSTGSSAGASWRRNGGLNTAPAATARSTVGQLRPGTSGETGTDGPAQRCSRPRTGTGSSRVIQSLGSFLAPPGRAWLNNGAGSRGHRRILYNPEFPPTKTCE